MALQIPIEKIFFYVDKLLKLLYLYFKVKMDICRLIFRFLKIYSFYYDLQVKLLMDT